MHLEMYDYYRQVTVMYITLSLTHTLTLSLSLFLSLSLSLFLSEYLNCSLFIL